MAIQGGSKLDYSKNFNNFNYALENFGAQICL